MTSRGIAEPGIEEEGIEAYQQSHLVKLFNPPPFVLGDHLGFRNLAIIFHDPESVTVEVGEILSHGLLLGPHLGDGFRILNGDGGLENSIPELAEAEDLGSLSVEGLSRELEDALSRWEKEFP